jgi:hypothetical protein
MSPARSKRQAAPQKRRREDIIRAVAVAAGIVIVTAILVWLLRPGPPGIPATGGLMNRQPRVSWLIGLALGITAFATWWVLKRSGRRTRARAKVILPIVVGAVIVAAVIGGFLWPGGLLRHDVAPAPEPPTTTTQPSTTSAPGAAVSTTVAGASGATGATGTPTTLSPTTLPTTTTKGAGTSTTAGP